MRPFDYSFRKDLHCFTALSRFSSWSAGVVLAVRILPSSPPTPFHLSLIRSGALAVFQHFCVHIQHLPRPHQHIPIIPQYHSSSHNMPALLSLSTVSHSENHLSYGHRFHFLLSAHQKEWKIDETRDGTRHASNSISIFSVFIAFSPCLYHYRSESSFFRFSFFFIIVSITAQ